MKTFASLVLTVLILAFAHSASATTILQFNQITFNDPFTINGSGSISAVNVPVNVSFDPSFCLIPGCGGLMNGLYIMNFTATSTSVASLNAGVIRQNQTGSISFIQPITLVNLFTVNFTDEMLGSAGGSNPTLNASEPPDSFTGTSDVFDPAKLGIPRGLALSFSDWTPGLGLNGTELAAATADATGTFNVTSVPESGSIYLMSFGIIALSAYRYIQSVRRQRCL
jgi:hypothetical protein